MRLGQTRAVALLSAVGASTALMINTPSSAQTCVPLQLQWTGDTTSPFFVSILPGGDTSAAPIVQFQPTNDTTLTWTVNVTAGTALTFQVRDGKGVTSDSAQVTVQKGPSTSCVNTTTPVTTSNTTGTGAAGGSTPTSSVPTSSGASQSGSGTKSSAPASSGAAASSASGGSSGSATSAAASATASKKSSAFPSKEVSTALGFLGVVAVGLIVIA